MTQPEALKLLLKMDRLIRMEFTGPPGIFARRLCISERTLFNYLCMMRELGAPVRYSRPAGSYIYAVPGQLVVEFNREVD